MEKCLGIRAISRGIAILQAVNLRGSATMMEIANAVDLAYPTTSRIVDTLVEYGMLERAANCKRYRPTALVQTLSLGYQSEDRLAVASRPHIVEMTKRCSWPMSVCSRVGMNMVIRESTHAMTAFTLTVYHPGYRIPLLSSSSGKAYLAFCAPSERNVIFEGLRQYHGASLSNRASIERILDDIRQRGVSVQEKIQHTANPGRTSSISAPIFDDELLVGTVTLIYFSSSMTIDQAVEVHGPSVRQCAERISAGLNAGVSAARSATPYSATAVAS